MSAMAARRTPSSRARQLRERKENMTESCLKKLRRQRARVRGAKGEGDSYRLIM